MNTLSAQLSTATLLHEVDMRMAQALDNFFQRSRTAIQDAILRAIAAQNTPSMVAIGQSCLDWLNTHPDSLSNALADQFRQHLAHPETFALQTGQPAELQLVDDTTLGRLLAEEKAAAHLSEELRPEMLLLFSRLLALRQGAKGDLDQTDLYGPRPVMRALSHALDSLGFDLPGGTLLLQCATAPLLDALKYTYTALNQFLNAQGVEERTTVRTSSAPAARRSGSSIGQDILAHIQSVAEQTNRTLPASPHAPAGESSFPTLLPSFIDSLARRQATLPHVPETAPGPSVRVLRQLQKEARHTDAGSFDLAVLDAVAGLFDFILDDPDIPRCYKSEIAHLQIPTLRVALVSPELFSDDKHPARRLIDLLGLFSRRFPENDPSHLQALKQVEAACTCILDDPDHQTAVFSKAHRALIDWLDDENVRVEDELAAEVANLELIERRELGTLLALENLQDLTARYPAPESVLRRLEAAWVPYMASLYVAEAGEGPAWRGACVTLQQLFLSLQSPDNHDAREALLQSIPHTNAELRRGLLAQGADPAHLKDFFSAITATQECWIRPAVGHQETKVSTFVPQHVSQEEIKSLAHRVTATPAYDPSLQQAQQLLEGEWVDFDPPFEGLSTARVAWVGVHGYLLFCDSAGGQRFSLDCDRLAAEIRTGRARIPEQSLTRKAMLCLRTHLLVSSD
jgi:Protein of unknown function (DUF1631)